MREVAAVLVWDLDGTLYRSAAACMHYAHGIAETLEEHARAPYVAAMERYLCGAGEVEASDGWEAAVVLAGGGRGASRAYGDAFARTRAFMLSDACELEMPEGLRELLERVAERARRVLVTNTPSFGVVPLLERLDLLGSFDEISCDSAKPRRFDIRLRAFADVNGLARRDVLSIGDHFVNDIQPALDAGCTAAYVDPFGVGPSGRAHLEAARFEDLLEPIEDWLEDR
jgi:FMN phosphatase YigB (HAD superfamily)